MLPLQRTKQQQRKTTTNLPTKRQKMGKKEHFTDEGEEYDIYG